MLIQHHRYKIKISSKLATEYHDVQTLPPVLAAKQPAGPKRPQSVTAGAAGPGLITNGVSGMKLIGGPGGPATQEP
jgi:hypothetical protein